MSAAPDYVYGDQADHTELARLRLLESVCDPDTNRFFDQLGAGPGWRCLEVAAGAGSIARALADRVGPAGHVVAVDADLRYLATDDLIARSNLEIRRLDVLSDEIEPAAFDLVHTRHLLAHLGRRAGDAFERMVAALRPGGWLLVEDIDMNGLIVVTADPFVRAAFDTVLAAARRVIVDRGGDPRIGLRLPGFFEDAGLVDISVEAQMPFVRGDGDRTPIALATLRAIRPQLVARGVAPSVVDTVLDALADPGYRAFDPPRIAVWGRRPSMSAS